MKYDLSLLRHQAKIKKLEKVADGQGGFTHTYSDLATLWGHFEELSIEKKSMIQRFVTEADAKIIMRRNDIVKEGLYAECRGSNYRIVGLSFSEGDNKSQQAYMGIYLRKIEEI